MVAGLGELRTYLDLPFLMPTIDKYAFVEQRYRKRVERLVDEAYTSKVTRAYDMLHDDWK